MGDSVSNVLCPSDLRRRRTRHRIPLLTNLYVVRIAAMRSESVVAVGYALRRPLCWRERRCGCVVSSLLEQAKGGSDGSSEG